MTPGLSQLNIFSCTHCLSVVHITHLQFMLPYKKSLVKSIERGITVEPAFSSECNSAQVRRYNLLESRHRVAWSLDLHHLP